MRERKRLMEERASAFVSLPGGLGTLEEFSEIVALRYLNRLNLPVVLLNQDGFYDDLLKYFCARGERGVHVMPTVHDLFTVAKTVDEVWRQLDQPVPFKPDAIWQ